MMRWFALSLVVFLFSSSAIAQEKLISPERISSLAVANMDGDYYSYRALLVDTEDGADLYIFIDAGEGMKLNTYSGNIVWRGGYGQKPHLEVTKNGALKVVSKNSAIGRDRWQQTLTVVFRKEQFLVAGYTYDYYDSLDLDNKNFCDVNLLTGRGIRNEKKFKTKMRALPVSEWTMDLNPVECFP